jgi:UDP-GlcNAc:undecaprenyl-phosphate GlcNAc-1-phosphate transferase
MISLLVVFILLNTIIFINLDRLSKFINIYDKPDNFLKKHKSEVPLIGGVIIILNIFTYIILELVFDLNYLDVKISRREYFSLIIFILSFFFIGLYDDKYKIKPDKKLFVSILVSIFVITINKDMLIDNISLSFFDRVIYLNNFKYFFSIFCIIILINSLNFYDGINGQSIIFFIISFSFIAIKSSFTLIYILIICNLLFILFLNLRNKLFLGDNGIFVISCLLIIFIIYEYNHLKSLKYSDEIFLLLILPGIDLVRLTIIRIIKGQNAFYGDRNHIHHLLISKLSLSISNIVLGFLVLLPNILYSLFKLNFFISITFFIISYAFIILKFSNKANRFR